jgi:hypothetical protein
MLLVASLRAVSDEIAKAIAANPDAVNNALVMANVIHEALRNHTHTWGDGTHRPVIVNGTAYDVDNKVADEFARLRAENKTLKSAVRDPL